MDFLVLYVWLLSFKKYYLLYETEIQDDDVQSLSCTFMSKKNDRIIESCNNFWIIYAIRLPLSQLSDYITKMLFVLNLHVIQEGPSVVYPWEKAMYLPSPHGQTFLPIFEKYIQAPPTPLHIPEQTQPFPTFTHISAHLPYTGPHIQTDLAKHTIKGCKVVFSRTVSMPLGLERHLWKCRIEWGESQLYEQI